MDITRIAFVIAVMFVVLAAILLLAWAAKRYMGGGRAARPKGSPLRRRERRLGLVEAASISPRHKLVLVRRDDTEHLLLLGGTTELVVESRIAGVPAERHGETRHREPQLGRPPGAESFGAPSVGPELPRGASPSFPPQTYGAATAGDYEPSLYRRDEDEVGFRDEAPDYGRREPEAESDYFASARGGDTQLGRPSYLGRDEADEEPPATSTYEKYRPTYRPQAEDDEPAYGDAEDERREEDEDAGEEQQSRILSRFLRKDTSE